MRIVWLPWLQKLAGVQPDSALSLGDFPQTRPLVRFIGLLVVTFFRNTQAVSLETVTLQKRQLLVSSKVLGVAQRVVVIPFRNKPKAGSRLPVRNVLLVDLSSWSGLHPAHGSVFSGGPFPDE